MKTGRNWFGVTLVLLSLLFYSSYYIPASAFPFSSLFAPAILIVLCINSLLLVLTSVRKKKWWVYPATSLLFGFGFILETFAFNSTSDKPNDLSILGYNVKSFREHKRYDRFSKELIEWAVSDSSQIKCFQEYSTNRRWKALDITGKLREKGYFAHQHKAKMEGDHSPGMATFSKFPILHRGTVWENMSKPNACIYTDILIHTDTIRIYNIHLESMQLELYRLKRPSELISTCSDIISRLYFGSKRHEEQIKLTSEHCMSSPHPFIIIGDFNETPYSSNYRLLDNLFHSSFHQAGNGFDFTLNNPLFFLRIDHQFSGPGMEATYYEVDRKARVSDHFPTRARYRLVKEND